MWIKTTKRDTGLNQTILGTAGEKGELWKGTELFLDDHNRLNVRFVVAQPEDQVHVRTLDSLRTNEWYHVGFTYDGTGAAAGAKLYINGKAAEQRTLHDLIRGDIYPATYAKPWLPFQVYPLRVGQSYRTQSGENGVFLGWMDELKLYDEALTPAQMWSVSGQPGPAPEKALEEHLLKQHPAYVDALDRYRAGSVVRRPCR